MVIIIVHNYTACMDYVINGYIGIISIRSIVYYSQLAMGCSSSKD